jgi:hypothetical protein
MAAQPPRPLQPGQEPAIADIERRIKLLAVLADALTQRGLIEEVLQTCKEITTLQRDLARLQAAHDARRRSRPWIEL